MKGLLGIFFLGKVLLIIKLSQCEAKEQRAEMKFTFQIFFPFLRGYHVNSQKLDFESESSSSSSSSSSSEEETVQGRGLKAEVELTLDHELGSAPNSGSELTPKVELELSPADQLELVLGTDPGLAPDGGSELAPKVELNLSPADQPELVLGDEPGLAPDSGSEPPPNGELESSAADEPESVLGEEPGSAPNSGSESALEVEVESSLEGEPQLVPADDSSPGNKPESSPEVEPLSLEVSAELIFSQVSTEAGDILTVPCDVTFNCPATWHENITEDSDIMMTYTVTPYLEPPLFPKESITICEASRMPPGSWANEAWKVLSRRTAKGSNGCDIKAGTYKFPPSYRMFALTPRDPPPCGLSSIVFDYELSHKGSDSVFGNFYLVFQLPGDFPNCTMS